MSDRTVVVAGAGGFIGGHLVRELLSASDRVVAVDSKPLQEWHQVLGESENVYNLAADMGGMGFIENNKALCMLSVLINTAPADGRREAGVERFFYSSSACVYAADKQTSPDVTPLKRGRRLPGHARGRLRLGEALQRADVPALHRGLRARDPRRALPQRLRPHGTYDGGREKAPAAICRKVAEAKLSGTARDRDLGRRRADAQLHLHRRLPARHAGDHGQRHRRADQPRQQRAGHDQPARRHRRGDRRHQARAPLRPVRAEGRARAQQRQHDDPRAPGVGARHPAAGRARTNPRFTPEGGGRPGPRTRPRPPPQRDRPGGPARARAGAEGVAALPPGRAPRARGGEGGGGGRVGGGTRPRRAAGTGRRRGRGGRHPSHRQRPGGARGLGRALEAIPRAGAHPQSPVLTPTMGAGGGAPRRDRPRDRPRPRLRNGCARHHAALPRAAARVGGGRTPGLGVRSGLRLGCAVDRRRPAGVWPDHGPGRRPAGDRGHGGQRACERRGAQARGSREPARRAGPAGRPGAGQPDAPAAAAGGGADAGTGPGT